MIEEDRMGTCLEKLDLLVLGQQELARFAPVRRMLPSVLNKAARMPVRLNTANRNTMGSG
jgi:hypothetical protein